MKGQRCPVCGAGDHRWVAEHNGLRVARCTACGHGYVWPVPTAEELDRIYQEAYYRASGGSIGFSDYDSLEPARRRMFGRHLDRIEGRLGGRRGRLLDVGCATGDFLKVARERGWEVLGADPSAARARVEALGIPLVGETVLDADVEPGSLDAVTFWDVLEHTVDPVRDLERARTLLRPGGVLAATVPDASNVLARASGRRWFGYKTAGEHLQFFTGESLRRAAGKADFRVETRRGVAWSCTLGFLGDRFRLYLGPPGRALGSVLVRPRLAGIVVSVPLVNQFVLGVAPG